MEHLTRSQIQNHNINLSVGTYVGVLRQIFGIIFINLMQLWETSL